MTPRVVVVAAAVTTLLAAPTPASTNPVQAATTTSAAVSDRAALSPGCVTRHEFRRARQDMRKWRVHRIFDTHGSFFGDPDNDGFSREYRQCRPEPPDECTAVVDYYIGRHGAARVEGRVWAVACYFED